VRLERRRPPKKFDARVIELRLCKVARPLLGVGQLLHQGGVGFLYQSLGTGVGARVSISYDVDC
jgi:hypothetical protein